MIKKLVLILFVCTALSSSASAQRFKAGIRAGIAGTQISGDQLGGFDKAGIVAGGLVSTELSEKFDIGFEVLYSQKGSRKNARPEKEDYITYLLRLNYFEVPVLLQWKFSNRFHFEAGPSFGALVSSLEEDEYGVIEQPRDFNKFELGIMGGMSVKVTGDFYFNIRGSNSVLPVREHVSGQGYRLNRGQYNSSILFTVHYIFRSKPSGE
jgi:hypothetical protein